MNNLHPPGFIHLHLHTEYSLCDGLVRLDALCEQLIASNMPAVAVTDHMNLFCAVKFYKKALAAGIKPIFGAELIVTNTRNIEKPFSLVALCQNQAGYLNLIALISKAYLQQQTGKPEIERAWLQQHNEGLIILSGGLYGELGQALINQNDEGIIQIIMDMQAWFPDRFYIELSRTGIAAETNYVNLAVDIADRFELPLVATNNVRFLNLDDFEAHEARVCIAQGHILVDESRPREYTPQQYLRTPQEMQAIFADLPDALANTVAIAERCSVVLNLGKAFLPNFPIPTGETPETYLSSSAKNGLLGRIEKLDKRLSDAEQATYQARLTRELDVINRMGFAGYFLIVADFIAWARENDVPVGPGRGSGAGSLVAYALRITDLDPLRYELLFERFLNPERVSMPDFDIDFCMDGRDRVIAYVAQKYGRDSVAQIITYGTMAAKAVIRDVGRVLSHPYPVVDAIAKLIPFELGITLEKALQQEPELARRYQEEEDVKFLIDLALKLEGITRNAGKHAGGVVIAPTVLTDFTALYCEPDGSNLVTQFDKDDVEAVGLVKFDFLGLRTLTIIKWALNHVNARHQTENKPLLDIEKIPLDDPQTFKMLQACQTTAVFQLESRGMKDIIKRLRPDDFEEIIALVALFRPGPLQSGMVDDFIDRKHGRAKVVYPHPLLASILQNTYGVILYQEQVMQIAQALADYSLGQADLLRKAMGKKKAEEMAAQRAIFRNGAKSKQIPEELADQIFDLMEKFAGYGFNKSHSAAYALVAYQTAWLKCHYPAEFMAAVLSSDMDNTDKVVDFIQDCQAMGLIIAPPNVNTSQFEFTVALFDDTRKTILYGLGAIKGVGENIATAIARERNANGPFRQLFDFCERLNATKLTRRTLEILISAGALDDFGVERATLFNNVELAIRHGLQYSKQRASGQLDLLSKWAQESPELLPTLVQVPPWREQKRLQEEKTVLGWYLSGHPMAAYTQEFKTLLKTTLQGIAQFENQSTMIAGMVTMVRPIMTKAGRKMAVVAIEDRLSRVDITFFPEAYEKYHTILLDNAVLLIEGEVRLDDFSGGYRVQCTRCYSLAQVRQIFGKQLRLRLVAEKNKTADLAHLQKILQPFCGGRCIVVCEYQSATQIAEIQFGQAWQVKLQEPMLTQLRELLGMDAVEIRYE